MSSTSGSPLDARQPVALELSYRTANALVTAYTASVSKGGVVFMSEQAVPVGSRFEFHLKVDGDDDPVSLLGLVVRSSRVGDRHQVAVQYSPTHSSRLALGRLLARMRVDTPVTPPVRQEPRIPVNLIARDALLATRVHVIENLSHGGMGVSLNRASEVKQLAVGATCGLEVRLHPGSSVVLRGHVVWVNWSARGNGARYGVCFARHSETEHLIIAGMLQLFRPQSLFLALGDDSVALLSGSQAQSDVLFDAEELVAIIVAEAQPFFEQLTGLPCRVARHPPGSDEPRAPGPLELSADLAGDVDIELALHASRASLETLARGAGYDGVDLEEANDSGLELMSSLAGHIADRMERLGLREEVLPFRGGEPLSSRRPFDRRELIEVWVGDAPLLLEAQLRLPAPATEADSTVRS